jgi:hypothetical protein
MPTLLEVQEAMSRSLIGVAIARPPGELGEAGAAAPVPGLDVAAHERLSIYRNTCRSTLVNALGLCYPAVQRLVGREFFESAAEHFIDGAASGIPESACLNEYGREFGAFLTSFAPAASLRYLADVADLEWAVNEALHAPEAARPDVAQLAARIGVNPAVRFVPHPSIRLLSLRYPADIIWRGVLDEDDATLASVDLASGPVWLLVERAQAGVQVHRLTEQGYRFTERLCAGVPLSTALDGLPEGFAAAPVGEEPPPVAADVLAQHLSAGRFIDALHALGGRGGIDRRRDSMP